MMKVWTLFARVSALSCVHIIYALHYTIAFFSPEKEGEGGRLRSLNLMMMTTWKCVYVCARIIYHHKRKKKEKGGGSETTTTDRQTDRHRHGEGNEHPELRLCYNNYNSVYATSKEFLFCLLVVWWWWRRVHFWILLSRLVCSVLLCSALKH